MPSRTQKGRRGVFVGIARNCAPHLDGVLKNLVGLSALYEEASFVFVVSDSVDSTASILNRWLSDGKTGQVIDLDDLEKRLPRRTERLAFVRNAYMDEVRRVKADFDHLVVVDLDDVLASPISIAGFAKAMRWLDAAPARAAAFANSHPRYYDLWALRHRDWCPDDCWQRVLFAEKDRMAVKLQIREVYSRMVKIPRWLPPFRVMSAFGGIAIYKLKLAVDGRYNGIDARDRETCEHVAFNLSIHKAGAQLCIHPALVVRVPVEHSYDARGFPEKMRLLLWWERFKRTLRWWASLRASSFARTPSLQSE